MVYAILDLINLMEICIVVGLLFGVTFGAIELLGS